MKIKSIKFIKEYLVLIVAIIGFFCSPYLLRLVDPTSGAYDAGVLQVMIIAMVQFCVFQAATWGAIKNIWPAIGAYMNEGFSKDFLHLTGWQKISVSLFVYFAVFAAFVMLSRVIQ